MVSLHLRVSGFLSLLSFVVRPSSPRILLICYAAFLPFVNISYRILGVVSLHLRVSGFLSLLSFVVRPSSPRILLVCYAAFLPFVNICVYLDRKSVV